MTTNSLTLEGEKKEEEEKEKTQDDRQVTLTL